MTSTVLFQLWRLLMNLPSTLKLVLLMPSLIIRLLMMEAADIECGFCRQSNSQALSLRMLNAILSEIETREWRPLNTIYKDRSIVCSQILTQILEIQWQYKAIQTHAANEDGLGNFNFVMY